MIKKKLFIFVYLSSIYLTHGENYIDPDIFSINFFDSMTSWPNYDKNLALTDPGTFKVKELYDNFVLKNLFYTTIPRIPLIIHQIWLGSLFPEVFKNYQQSWIQMHPYWLYILWTEKEIENFGLINKGLYDQVVNFGMKSDIARIEILNRYGGLYIDVDFECLKPFDILHHYFDFYTGCGSDAKLVLFNGLIASVPDHPILKKYINKLKISTIMNDDLKIDYSKILDLTGPYFFTRCFLESLLEPIGRCVAFPVTYFYPYSNYNPLGATQAIIKEHCVKKETFAIHWFARSWQY